MGYWLELKSWIFRDPVKLIRYLVLFICCCIVIVQLYECFSRLRNPPISTHSYYSLNETIEMPAITICRDPPYKYEVLSELSRGDCPHPKYATCWMSYPYDELELEEFFMNSSFNESETFLDKLYGLNGLRENIEVTSRLHFFYGLCYTIRPKVNIKRALRSSGYSMILTHHMNHSDSEYQYYEDEPGWHIYVHDWRESITEVNTKGSGRIEYVFAAINEDIEIKLQSQFFSNIQTRTEGCDDRNGYSDLRCDEACVWNFLTEKSNCSGPWMQNVPQKPCSNYKSMQNLTKEYGKIYYSDEVFPCTYCKQPCYSRIFPIFVQSRKNFNQDMPYTQVWIYYTTKLVSVVEERPSYDSTQFIADIGGSLGFLLGLSVLSLIGILEHVTLFFCGGLLKKVEQKHEKRMKEEGDQRSQRSDETVDIATIYKNKATI